jgi:hypothetical protein
MATDAYLQITFPGMSDWVVEEIRGEDNTVIGYKIERTQIAEINIPGAGNEHKLDEIRLVLNERSRRLNATAEPLILPQIS